MKTKIGKDVKISEKATINVSEYLEIGDRTIINDYAKIEGREVIIGRESFIHEYSWIGGGSCFEKTAYLHTGDFLHLGKFAHINTAAGVIIGEEVGIGHQSNIWTHGSYSPYDMGFPFQFAPVKIGSWSWLPHAWVNPGVRIGQHVVVAAMSLVNSDLPSGCLAGGVPAAILKRDEYPKTEINFDVLIKYLDKQCEFVYSFFEDNEFVVADTTFYLYDRSIKGPVTQNTERFKNLLRRAGIRFHYFNDDGYYKPWKNL